MSNENKGENLPNQETDEQKIERLRTERDGLKKDVDTYKAQKSHWKKKAESKGDKPKEKQTKPNESDKSDRALETAQRALLNSAGFKASEQQDYIFEQAERLKADVSEIIGDDYHQSKLKAIKDKIDTKGSMPKGGGKGGGGASDSVDYWIAKDELPEDQELAEKVIEAKMKKQKSKNQFSDTMYVG